MQNTESANKNNDRYKVYIYAAVIFYIFILFLVAKEIIKIDVSQIISKLEMIKYPSSLIDTALNIGNKYTPQNGVISCILLLQISVPLIICFGVFLSLDIFKSGIILAAEKRTLLINVVFSIISFLMALTALFTFVFLIGKSSVFCAQCEVKSVVFMLSINFIKILMSGVFLSVTGILLNQIINYKRRS